MARIAKALSSYARAEGDLPSFRCVNLYAEKGLDGELVLQSRPGLDDRGADMGLGPVRALFRRDGVFAGDLFGVSGGNLYRVTTSLGVVAGSGPVSLAGNEIGLIVTAGSTPRYYNGTTLADIAFPDSANVAKVFAGGSRFWFIRADTGKIYWTDALEADVEALDFATAESLPDKLLDGLWIDGMAVLFGAESVEMWQQTGDATLPITPLTNLVFEKGIKATGCASAIASTFAWVGSDNVVYLTNENTPISNEGLNRRIEASTTCRLFSFYIDGAEFLALRLDDETQVWRKDTGTWHEFSTYGLTNWAANCHAGGIFGSATDGKTLAFGTDKDEGVATGGIMQRIVGAGFSVDGGLVTVNNLRVRANTGSTPYLTGTYADPVVEMRVSADAGKTWDDWTAAYLGKQGDYKRMAEFRALGAYGYPGFLCEFRCSDPVPFRISDVLINEPFGGR